MNKKKLVSLCLVLALLVTAAIGGTMAYFSDKDAQTNVFTTGDVKIDLWEDFDNDGDGLEELIPTTGKDADGNIINAVEKEVYVENTGSEAAYVRVHIAIPQILDNGYDTFDASQNVLHFNYDKDSIGEGKWDWSKSNDDKKYEGNWNFYTTNIDGVWYNVYVVTYTSELAGATANAAGGVTVDAMHQVYLEATTTQADIEEINKTLNGEWKIYVAAEGTQAQGFDDAFTALNTAFGTPGNYAVDWTTVAGKTIVDLD